MKKAYIFRGGPGSGKSTVVPEFARSLGGKVAYIQEDMFRWDFHLIGREVEDVSDDERRFAYENMLLILEEYCKRGGYQLVVDGLFTWDNPNSSQGSVQDCIETLERYGFEYKLIILKADKQVLKQRNSSRDYVVKPDEFDRLHAEVYDEIGPNEVIIDSSSLTPGQTIERIKELGV